MIYVFNLPGLSLQRTGSDGSDGSDGPASLTAITRNSYSSPSTTSVIVVLFSVPATCPHSIQSPPGYDKEIKKFIR